MLQIARVCPIALQNKIGLDLCIQGLARLRFRNKRHFLEAYHFKQEFSLHIVCDIFLDILIGESELAIFVLARVHQYILYHCVHNLNAIEKWFVTSELNTHV